MVKLADVVKAPFSAQHGYQPLLQAANEVRKQMRRGNEAARAEMLGTAPTGMTASVLNPGAMAFVP